MCIDTIIQSPIYELRICRYTFKHLSAIDVWCAMNSDAQIWLKSRMTEIEARLAELKRRLRQEDIENEQQ